MDAGANQSFGADWPASAYLSTYKPLELLEAAVTRRLPGEPDMPPRNPDQSVSLAEAIIAMTRNTAIQVGELESLGSITEGKLADLVLLEKNLFDIPAETINATSCRGDRRQRPNRSRAVAAARTYSKAGPQLELS